MGCVLLLTIFSTSNAQIYYQENMKIHKKLVRHTRKTTNAYGFVQRGIFYSRMNTSGEIVWPGQACGEQISKYTNLGVKLILQCLARHTLVLAPVTAPDYQHQ